MSFITGSGASLWISKETTFGTAVAPNKVIDITSEGIKTTVTKDGEGSLLASKTNMERSLTAVNVDGSFDEVLRPDNAGLQFALAMGGKDTVSASGSHHKHSIVLADPKATLPSFTVFVDRLVKYAKYAGCTVSSVTFTFPAKNYVTASVSLQGVKEEDCTDTEKTAMKTIAFAQMAYKCISAKLTLGGVELDASSVTLTIDNALADAPATYTTGLYRGQPEHAMRDVTVSIDIPYSAQVETIKSNYLLTDTYAALALEFGNGSTDYTGKVSIPNFAVTAASGAISGEDAISSTIEGDAVHVGTTEPITVEIVDDTATAYNA